MTTSKRLPLTLALGIGGIPFAPALALAQAAEAAGFTSVSFSDRPHDPILDGWTLSAAIVARTERIRVFHSTLNIPYRFPAVLAKEAATLDLISNGRLDLCLGAGGEGNRPLYDSIGVPLGQPADRLQDLRDYIAILRGLWSHEKFSYQGRAFVVTEAAGQPHPVQRPIPIWVGALMPRSLRLAGQLADGFLKNQGWASVEEMRELNRQVSEAATKVGRDPLSIRRIINGAGFLAGSRAEAEAAMSNGGPFGRGGLYGAAEDIIATIREYRDAGVDTFAVRFPAEQAQEQIRRFGVEVVPEVARL